MFKYKDKDAEREDRKRENNKVANQNEMVMNLKKRQLRKQLIDAAEHRNFEEIRFIKSKAQANLINNRKY